ncbi:MAG: LacI family DNA-binding transcriptional regulator [Treponemataceae bacterium]
MGIRIKDIAEASGVSPASVSLVLNNRPGVGENTRKRILGIARAMEYDSEKALNLTRSKSETIRFLRISRHGHVVNNDHAVFIANYIDGMGQAVRDLGLNLEIVTIEYGSLDSIIEAAQASWIGGAVILGTELSQQELKTFEAIKTPLVIMDNYDDFLGFNFVDMNNKESVHTAVTYLKNRGHRSIGLVTSDITTPNFLMRANAFKESLAFHELEYRKEDIFHVDSTYDGAYADMLAALSLRQRHPTALFCVNDIMAFGTIKALKERGLRVPEDVSVIGFDNLPSSAISDPPLTSIDVSKMQIGRLAVRTLFENITSRLPMSTVKILVSGELIERSSVKSL